MIQRFFFLNAPMELLFIHYFSVFVHKTGGIINRNTGEASNINQQYAELNKAAKCHMHCKY